MSISAQLRQNFINRLYALADDRQALAALRRGLGQPPGIAGEMHRYIAPFLVGDLRTDEENAFYVVAALYGAHPATTQTGNFGDHFRATRDGGNDEAVERRFTVLLAAHTDDLPFYLRQAISWLRSKEQPVNYHELFYDLLQWGHPDRFVQRKWAKSFWRQAQPTTSTDELAA